jgi:hypothetical protein
VTIFRERLKSRSKLNGLPVSTATVIGIDAESIFLAGSVAEFRMNDVRPWAAFWNSTNVRVVENSDRLVDLHQDAGVKKLVQSGHESLEFTRTLDDLVCRY